jgi:hypothetical protein
LTGAFATFAIRFNKQRGFVFTAAATQSDGAEARGQKQMRDAGQKIHFERHLDSEIGVNLPKQ